MSSRYAPTRKALLFWTLFIGVGAVGGALCMLLDPSGHTLGMDAKLPYFQVLPLADVLFQDFTFSGWALLVVNGLTNLTAALLLLRRTPLGDILGGVFGVTLMLWIGIQFYLFPLNFMSTAYFVFGLIQAATGYMAWVFRRQESFHVSEADYPNLGRDPKRLVVCFSRMGYTKRVALEEADRTGACFCQLRARERTAGTLGFWWCGRFGMHRWAMPVEDTGLDLRQFDHVTLCSPIWVFQLSAPMRSFCESARGQIREADYLLVHHQKSPYWNAADEMDRLLGLAHSPAVSLSCREGSYLSRHERARDHGTADAPPPPPGSAGVGLRRPLCRPGGLRHHPALPLHLRRKPCPELDRPEPPPLRDPGLRSLGRDAAGERGAHRRLRPYPPEYPRRAPAGDRLPHPAGPPAPGLRRGGRRGLPGLGLCPHSLPPALFLSEAGQPPLRRHRPGHRHALLEGLPGRRGGAQLCLCHPPGGLGVPAEAAPETRS